VAIRGPEEVSRADLVRWVLRRLKEFVAARKMEISWVEEGVEEDGDWEVVVESIAFGSMEDVLSAGPSSFSDAGD